MEEKAGIVHVTAEETRNIDDTTIREFKVDVPLMMENAGRACATMARRMPGETFGKRIACLVGNISLPRKVYQRFGQKKILFQKDTILKI